MASRKKTSSSIQSSIAALVRQAVEEAVATELARAQATIESTVQAQVNAALKATAAPVGGRTSNAKDAGVLRYLARHPDSRLEEIAAGLRKPSATLKPVMVRLVQQGDLRKSGVARGTRYRLSTTTRAAPARGKAARDKTGKRVRRSADDLDKLAGRIHGYVTKHPDSRSEQIAEGLNVPSKDLVRPLKMLLQQKAISSKGKARGTQYAATGRAPKGAASGTKPARKKAKKVTATAGKKASKKVRKKKGGSRRGTARKKASRSRS
jgi:hypothetical protein